MNFSPAEVQVLQKIIRRESLSLLQYTPEAFPWIRSTEQESLAQLEKMVGEQARAIAGLQQLLARHRVPLGYVGTFPDYTGVNFIALDCLLQRLISEQRRGLTELARDLSQIMDGEARGLVEQMQEMKQRHLKALEGLAASRALAPVS